MKETKLTLESGKNFVIIKDGIIFQMCGIFGYIGPKNASEVILEGLKRLEYRGYDSWGISVLADQIKVDKKVGAIGDLNQDLNLPKAKIGIGHTRWATHGGITQNNAHPHFSSDNSFILAQNGIVENYQALKDQLKKDRFKFETETDTEVIVRLIEKKFSLQPERSPHEKLIQAIRDAFQELKGRNTIIILTKDNQIIAARNGSPLVVGINSKLKELFFSSDTLSFAPYVEKVLAVENGQMVISYDGQVSLLDIRSGKKLPTNFEKIDFKSSKVDKEGYDHFMLKEIQESPYVIRQLLNQELEIFQDFVKAVKNSGQVYTVGSGTAGVAASQIAYYLRAFAKIKAIHLIGADASEYMDLFSKDDVIIAPSQSGETADVLEVLEIVRKKGVKIASYVNMPGSTMTRISDFKFMANAGPEICVVSTKVFTSQIAWGYLMSKIISGSGKEGQDNLKKLVDEMDRYLNTGSNHEYLREIAKDLIEKKDIFLLGKSQNFNIMKEGMVKIIEGSYIHAHDFPAGDLKHYAITLMEKGVPVIAAISEDKVKLEVLNAVNEVRARGAEVIGISPEKYENLDATILVPDVGETAAIMNVIPLHLLAYYMAIELGRNPDKPRNLAKSVTVK